MMKHIKSSKLLIAIDVPWHKKQFIGDGFQNGKSIVALSKASKKRSLEMILKGGNRGDV